MLYRYECRVIKKQYIPKMSVAEVRMLRWRSGNILTDRIRNECISKKIEVMWLIIKWERTDWVGLDLWKVSTYCIHGFSVVVCAVCIMPYFPMGLSFGVLRSVSRWLFTLYLCTL